MQGKLGGVGARAALMAIAGVTLASCGPFAQNEATGPCSTGADTLACAICVAQNPPSASEETSVCGLPSGTAPALNTIAAGASCPDGVTELESVVDVWISELEVLPRSADEWQRRLNAMPDDQTALCDSQFATLSRLSRETQSVDVSGYEAVTQRLQVCLNDAVTRVEELGRRPDSPNILLTTTRDLYRKTVELDTARANLVDSAERARQIREDVAERRSACEVLNNL